MAISLMSTASTQVITPTRFAKTNWIVDPTQLSSYQSLEIPASSTIQSELGGLTSMPVILMSQIGAIKSINIHIEVEANGSNADTWTLHAIPVWYGERFPLFPNSINWMRFPNVDSGTQVYSRTQPASTGAVQTLMHARYEAGETGSLETGGGSGTYTPGPLLVASTAPGFVLDLVAGSNDQLTINSLVIYGTYEELN